MVVPSFPPVRFFLTPAGLVWNGHVTSKGQQNDSQLLNVWAQSKYGGPDKHCAKNYGKNERHAIPIHAGLPTTWLL